MKLSDKDVLIADLRKVLRKHGHSGFTEDELRNIVPEMMQRFAAKKGWVEKWRNDNLICYEFDAYTLPVPLRNDLDDYLRCVENILRFFGPFHKESIDKLYDEMINS